MLFVGSQFKSESPKSKDYEIVSSFAKCLVTFYLIFRHFNLIAFKATRNFSQCIYTFIKKIVFDFDETRFFLIATHQVCTAT